MRLASEVGPRWRKMSATSTAGRDNGGALAGWLHLAQQQVEGAVAIDITVDQGGDSGRIKAAIFQAPQPFDEPVSHWFFAGDRNDTTVSPSPFCVSGTIVQEPITCR